MLEIEVGRIVGGKYELVRILGHGSMGQVWVANHRTLGENVALKLLARAALGGEGEHPLTSAARFRFEAQTAARLSRKTRHIVRVTDHGEDVYGLIAFLVMELLEGETLERLLGRQGPMWPADVVRVVAQVARALEEAHAEGIVHRDLKPANIFVTRDEEGRLLIKLLDFGIARAIRTQCVAQPFATGNGRVCGTAGYMSPEQACASNVEPQCDLWALATVAYEALTGALPVSGTSTAQVLQNLHAGRLVPLHVRNPNLPAGLGAFFDRAFARGIERRFVSASQLALAFAGAVGPGGPAPSRLRWRPDTWAQVGLVGTVSLLLGFAATVAALSTSAHSPRAAVLVASRFEPCAGENEPPIRIAHAPGFEGPALPASEPLGLGVPEVASDRFEWSVIVHQPGSGTLSSTPVAGPQIQRSAPAPRLAPPVLPAPHKSVDRSAVL